MAYIFPAQRPLNAYEIDTEPDESDYDSDCSLESRPRLSRIRRSFSSLRRPSETDHAGHVVHRVDVGIRRSTSASTSTSQGRRSLVRSFSLRSTRQERPSREFDFDTHLLGRRRCHPIRAIRKFLARRRPAPRSRRSSGQSSRTPFDASPRRTGSGGFVCPNATRTMTTSALPPEVTDTESSENDNDDDEDETIDGPVAITSYW